MTLTKRIKRSVRENISFYVPAILLTMVTIMMFYLFYIGGTGINDFGDIFFESQSIEDAHFTTYIPISDEDISELESKYNVTLEAQKSYDLVNGDTTIRMFLANEKIDLYAITAGANLTKESDIIISEGYAVNMGVNVGDTMEISGETFTVVGFFQRPDYLYMLEDEGDSYKNITTFFLAYVTADTFDRLGEPSTTYLVRYNDADTEIAFRKAVNETYITASYLDADDNARIIMVHEQADMFILCAYVLLVIMPLITVFLICIMISRKIREEQRLIGTLTALGYSKGALARHYAIFAAIPGIVGGLLCFVVTSIFDQTFGELCLSDYEPMHATFTLPTAMGLLGVIVPTVMYVAAAVLATYRILKADTVDMLNNKAGGKDNIKAILRKSNISFKKKYPLRSLVANPTRALCVILGVFLGSAIILMCLGIVDSVANISDDAMANIGSFEYEYILNTLMTDEPAEGSPMLLASFTSDKSDDLSAQLTFMGVADDNPYLNLTLEDGTEITDLSGYYLSTVAAKSLNVDVGDELTFYNPLNLEEFTVTVAGIADYDIACAMFTSGENMANLLGVANGTYNAIMSDVALDMDDSILRQTIKKSSLLEQTDTILSQMTVVIYTFGIMGLIICVASIYGVVQMMIKEQAGNIAMLKILGYQDKEINRIVLSANHILLPIGILVSIPVVYAALDTWWMLFVSYGVMLIRSYVSPTSYIIAIILTSACYFGSMALVGRKTRNVEPEVALKVQE